MKYIAILRYWILTYLHWLLLWSTCFISSLISYHRPTLFCCNFKAQWLKMQPGPLIGFSCPFLSFQWCEILPIDCAGTWFSLVFMYTISWFWNADPLATTVQLLYIYQSFWFFLLLLLFICCCLAVYCSWAIFGMHVFIIATNNLKKD